MPTHEIKADGNAGLSISSHSGPQLICAAVYRRSGHHEIPLHSVDIVTALLAAVQLDIHLMIFKRPDAIRTSGMIPVKNSTGTVFPEGEQCRGIAAHRTAGIL